MNKKAFTLVELIATIVILGVIMTIAIPNVLSIIEKNKQEDFIEAAKMLITEVEYKVRSDPNIELPKEDNHVIAITLNYLNSGNFEQSSYEYPYDKLSFVLIVKSGNDYKYYVHLTASQAYSVSTVTTYGDNVLIDSKNRGISLATYEALNSDDRFDLVKKADEVDLDLFKSMNESMNEGSSITIGVVEIIDGVKVKDEVEIIVDNILI